MCFTFVATESLQKIVYSGTHIVWYIMLLILSLLDWLKSGNNLFAFYLVLAIHQYCLHFSSYSVDSAVVKGVHLSCSVHDTDHGTAVVEMYPAEIFLRSYGETQTNRIVRKRNRIIDEIAVIKCRAAHHCYHRS